MPRRSSFEGQSPENSEDSSPEGSDQDQASSDAYDQIASGRMMVDTKPKARSQTEKSKSSQNLYIVRLF